MCGIAGLIKTDGVVADRQLLARMLAVIAHRGPDGSGIWSDGQAALGHVRLSIIDPVGGGQPMCNEDGTLWITFNGEIFNYVELMATLESRGHQFRTRCDTEVILHAFEEYGPRCVEQFNGQWSFVIWDTRQRTVFASRDRLGVRPFFFTRTDQEFLFASEVKALLQSPRVRPSLDLTSLDQLFTFWTPLAGRTMFTGIDELAPGHNLFFEAGRVLITRYWHPDYPTTEMAPAQGQHVEDLQARLVDAVRLRLRSDVPVGAYLSGGLDSSLTSALIRQFTDASLTTFSVTFDDPEFDESHFQQEVSRYIGTQHRAIACGGEEIGRVFPDVGWHTEKPLLRTAPAPLYLLAQHVKNSGHKVVITGEGADEMLGGYDLFKEAKVRRFWARQPESTARPRLLDRLYPYLPGLQAQSSQYRQAFFKARPQDLLSPFFSHLPRWEMTAQIKRFYSKQTRDSLQGYSAADEFASRLPRNFAKWAPLSQAQYLETVCLLPGYILSSQGDRMSMAHGVEGRFPFLDVRVVELAAQLPPRLKLQGLNEKHILKQVAQGFVPESVRQRSKQPYRAPDACSFFGTAAKRFEFGYVRDLLSPDRINRDGVFHAPAVEKLVAKAEQGALSGTRDNMALVGILSTQLLIDRFLSQAQTSATSKDSVSSLSLSSTF